MIHIIHMRKTGVKHGLQLVLVLFLLIISDILRENLQLNAYLRLYVLYCFLTFFYIKMRLNTGFLDLGYTSE